MPNRQPLSTSPWAQTMNKIHSPLHDNETARSPPPETSMDKGATKFMPLQDENLEAVPPRKRNNSLIPVELMKNNSGEGGMECAALATVFGVPEYIDSKIFWERQQYQNDGLLPRKQNNASAQRPNLTSSMSESNKYGYVSVNSTSIMSRPLTSSNTSDEAVTVVLHNENQSKLISSYVDSVLDTVGSSELLKPSFPGTTSAPTPTPTKSFSLPKIPTVSEFNDILYEGENGFDLMFPANPSSILIHSSTPIIRTESSSSINSSFVLSSQSAKNPVKATSNDTDTESVGPTEKLSVLIGPPRIFDLILSDNDERFIVWGPDPIALSSSMATTTTPEGPSSYATLYNNQPNKRPELKGFSSNATSTMARSSPNLKTGHGGRPSFASVRLSAQRWSDSLVLGSKHNQKENNDIPGGSLLLKKAFGLKANHIRKRNSNSSIQTVDIPNVIEAATIHKLVEKLTSTLDYTFMTDFFLTYRDFLKSEDLCQLLISRFYWALHNDEESRRIVRIRTFVVLRHWLNNYFVHDFIGNRPLRKILTDFLNKISRHPLVKESPRDQRIVKSLKRVVRRLKKLYYNRSTGASRVKVIAPPPPTAEQEQMGEIVRAKLSQNAIRRKTALGMDMSSHHNGNMAVQDARFAPVVVVGSVNMKGSFIDTGIEQRTSSIAASRRDPSLYSAPVPRQLNETDITKRGLDDTHTIRSSIHHPYDKSIHEVPIGTGSMISVLSGDSLESDLSAGETIPDDESESEDDQSHIHRDSIVEYDEHDRHWLKEQQETLDYFRSINSSRQADTPGMSQSSSLTQLDSTQPQPLHNESDIIPVAQIQHNIHTRPKIPDAFFNVEVQESIAEYPAPTSVISEKKEETPRIIRRVPSERWCKSDDDYQSKHPLDVVNSKALPDELLRELSGEEVQLHKSFVGLTRKKSIERRKSEKSFQDAMSSTPSSAATSPYLHGTALSDHDVPDVPELPPLTSNMFDIPAGYKVKSPKRKKSLLLKKKPIVAEPESVETFASIPYEATQAITQSEKLKEEEGKMPPKRRLSRALSKVFRPNSQDAKSTKATSIKNEDTMETINNINETKPLEQEPVELQADNEHISDQTKQQQSGHLVSLIAQRLRVNSVDDGREDNSECSCSNCSGDKDSTTVCRRLSVLIMEDEERRSSFELRRRRGASIDMGHYNFNQQNSVPSHRLELQHGKDIKTGPVYLGHLQARSAIGSTIAQDDDDDVSDRESSDDNSTVSYTPSEKSLPTDAQAGSTRARMSYLSQAKTAEPEMPSFSINDQMELQKTRSTSTEVPAAVPRPINSYIPKTSTQSFIMSYRTSKIASQLCYIERDVLIKVGWEELIHCKWTKMDANGKINPGHTHSSFNNESIVEDEAINYTRQSELRRTEEQGIEQVIQRFNTVCQWVSSEIVRTRNIHERVKLIEKFVRLAKKCKMYSNYATLVQILLGLQSPAVARLEKTWAKVSAKCHRTLNKLTEFTSPMKNWKNIRDSMTEVAEEYGNSPAEVQVEMPGTTANRQKFKKTTRIKIPFGGCIPFLGIYLSDLVFNSEKPRFLTPNLESQRIYRANNTRNMPDCLNQPLVNFRKHRVIATVIKRVLTFQGLSTRYSFDADGVLLDKCRNLEVLDPAKIRELSAALE